ncbi:MAG: UDP-3-O-(3-hydroxymyristoyl)glucosamine N-acyltransferase [Deltaproteobacteria bacterium HGW-Deltaproteobacteria-11]|nr:MAG: UDP-3-O-(3-hydroxymyristoyl)glucosamine N-acyltransferase [Deltaproteobacteria bacterium HGW-Deltaproteobacteria-11]
MPKTLHELAIFLNGRVAGDGDVLIEQVRGIDEAGKGDLTFVSNAKYRKKLETTGASAILVPPKTEAAGKNLLIVEDPYIAFGKALALFYPEDHGPAQRSPQAFVDKTAVVADDAVIYPGVYVGPQVRIDSGAVLYPGVYIGPEAAVGEQSVLYPGVKIYRKCLIGKRVILHAGVVVGADGFGFAKPGRENIKIPQTGIVQIDDDVEVGANTTIDRATLGRTWIQRGVKIDNLVQVAHNVVIGEYSVIVAQVGISGSTKLGKGVIIGGQAGLVGHIEIGDHVMVGAQSGIHKDIAPGRIVMGSPQRPHRDFLRIEACVSRLPEMRQTIAALEKKVAEMEKIIEKKRNSGKVNQS